MRKRLIYNYWLIIISWCMFLNDLTLLANIIVILACAMLLSIKRRINFWRMSFVSILAYVAISLFLFRSNISYYFPKLFTYLALISLNLSLTNERLYIFKSKGLVPFLMAIVLSMSVLSIVAILLPNNLYTIFTKSSLEKMIFLIFLPYLIPLIICVIYKSYVIPNMLLKNKHHENGYIKVID